MSGTSFWTTSVTRTSGGPANFASDGFLHDVKTVKTEKATQQKEETFLIASFVWACEKAPVVSRLVLFFKKQFINRNPIVIAGHPGEACRRVGVSAGRGLEKNLHPPHTSWLFLTLLKRTL